MIVHIVHDEKFIDSGISFFNEVAPSRHLVVVLGSNPNQPLKYIKNIEVIRAGKRQLLTTQLRKALLTASCVVFHSLPNDSMDILRFLSLLKYRGKVVWIGWGYDYYNFIRLEQLEEQTKSRFAKKLNEQARPKLARAALNWLWKSIRLGREHAISRVDYFAPVIYEEYILVKEALGAKLKAEFLNWNYGYDFDNIQSKPLGNKILVGNSASPTNNHLEVFTMLSKANLGPRKVVVPLSYGDEVYRRGITDAGLDSLGDCFEPLTEFLPMEKFSSVLDECSHVVMNHRRQQAAGTILLAMEKGARVFLNEVSPLYTFFRTNGFHVDALSLIAESERVLAERLSAQKVEHNRLLIREFFGKQRCLENTKKLLTLVD